MECSLVNLILLFLLTGFLLQGLLLILVKSKQVEKIIALIWFCLFVLTCVSIILKESFIGVFCKYFSPFCDYFSKFVDLNFIF